MHVFILCNDRRSTLGARGFSCEVFGVGYVSTVTRRRSCPCPSNARKNLWYPGYGRSVHSKTKYIEYDRRIFVYNVVALT